MSLRTRKMLLVLIVVVMTGLVIWVWLGTFKQKGGTDANILNNIETFKEIINYGE